LAVRSLILLALLALGAATIAAQTPTPTPTPPSTPRQIRPRNESSTPKRVPTLALEVGVVTPVVEGVKRASASTVCAGDKVLLRATTSEPNIPPSSYAWVSSGGKIVGEGAEVYLDTTGLPPGDYHITAVAHYRGIGVCDADCSAYDSKTIRISPCPPLIICFTSPVITVTPETRTIQPGEAVAFTASEVSGGQGYGRLTYRWKSSAGDITGQGTTARLDTTGVAPSTTIEVSVAASSPIATPAAQRA
jgi:hypothetical protein